MKKGPIGEGAPSGMTAGAHSADELLQRLCLERENAPYGIDDYPAFPPLVSDSYVRRMRKGDWFDPLLLQVLPRREEKVLREGFVDDAVGDAAACVAPGLLHKYASRVLLLASSFCAMHCRFCFRRAGAFAVCGVDDVVREYIEAHPGIDEVILSGGDPLCLGADDFCSTVRGLMAIPQVATIRIHSRLPIADPRLFDEEMLDVIAEAASVKSCVVVVHANHANEFDDEVSAVLSRLRASGALLLNQTVLLAGVNDTADSLARLSRVLVTNGVLPYYLHQLDRVAGSWHFEVPEEKGRSLVAALREQLPGYAVPRYVRDVSGERSKLPL